jgi:hypothetical protein
VLGKLGDAADVGGDSGGCVVANLEIFQHCFRSGVITKAPFVFDHTTNNGRTEGAIEKAPEGIEPEPTPPPSGLVQRPL